MQLFHQFLHEIVPEALKRGVRVRVLVSEGRNLPGYIVKVAEKIEAETQHCTKFSLNLCVRCDSFGPVCALAMSLRLGLS